MVPTKHHLSGRRRSNLSPMVFSESPDKTTYTASIPGILDERTIILHRDASGKPLSNVTAMDTWSNAEQYADNELYNHDPELRREWDHSGAYANIKYFNLTKTMYDRKKRLASSAISPDVGPGTTRDNRCVNQALLASQPPRAPSGYAGAGCRAAA